MKDCEGHLLPPRHCSSLLIKFNPSIIVNRQNIGSPSVKVYRWMRVVELFKKKNSSLVFLLVSQASHDIKRQMGRVGEFVLNSIFGLWCSDVVNIHFNALQNSIKLSCTSCFMKLPGCHYTYVCFESFRTQK